MYHFLGFVLKERHSFLVKSSSIMPIFTKPLFETWEPRQPFRDISNIHVSSSPFPPATVVSTTPFQTSYIFRSKKADSSSPLVFQTKPSAIEDFVAETTSNDIKANLYSSAESTAEEQAMEKHIENKQQADTASLAPRRSGKRVRLESSIQVDPSTVSTRPTEIMSKTENTASESGWGENVTNKYRSVMPRLFPESGLNASLDLLISTEVGQQQNLITENGMSLELREKQETPSVMQSSDEYAKQTFLTLPSSSERSLSYRRQSLIQTTEKEMKLASVTAPDEIPGYSDMGYFNLAGPLLLLEFSAEYSSTNISDSDLALSEDHQISIDIVFRDSNIKQVGL